MHLPTRRSVNHRVCGGRSHRLLITSLCVRSIAADSRGSSSACTASGALSMVVLMVFQRARQCVGLSASIALASVRASPGLELRMATQLPQVHADHEGRAAGRRRRSPDRGDHAGEARGATPPQTTVPRNHLPAFNGSRARNVQNPARGQLMPPADQPAVLSPPPPIDHPRTRRRSSQRRPERRESGRRCRCPWRTPCRPWRRGRAALAERTLGRSAAVRLLRDADVPVVGQASGSLNADLGGSGWAGFLGRSRPTKAGPPGREGSHLPTSPSAGFRAWSATTRPRPCGKTRPSRAQPDRGRALRRPAQHQDQQRDMHTIANARAAAAMNRDRWASKADGPSGARAGLPGPASRT